MRVRDRLETLLVGVLLGLIIYWLARDWSWLSKASQGDWFSLFGAMLGAVFAVTGAVYVEAYKRRIALRDGTDVLGSALVELGAALANLGGPLFTKDLSKRVAEITDRQRRLKNALDFIDYGLDRHPLTDASVWHDVRSAQDQARKALAVPHFAFDQQAGEDLCSMDTTDHWLKYVQPPVRESSAANKRARSRLLGLPLPGPNG